MTQEFNESTLQSLNISNMTVNAALGTISAAETFFPDKSFKEAPSNERATVSSDTDGLINIILVEPDVSGSLQTLLEKQKQNLIDLTGLATAYVNRQDTQFPTSDPRKKYDVELWNQVFNQLPLMGPSQFTSQNYSKRVRGVEIAKEFLQFILTSVITQTPALGKFQQFLQGQGESIKIGTEENADGFQMGTICINLETMKVGNTVELVPKIQAYFVKFTRQNYNFVGACVNYDEVDISFSYDTAVSVFNYKALENPKVKAQFDKLIGNAQIEDIESSANFFAMTL